jgi:hypothetical protein
MAQFYVNSANSYENSSFNCNKKELSQKNIPLSLTSFNFFSGAQPGIYEIHCKSQNKRYIGEAGNVLDRLAKHNRLLMTNTGECTELQLEWNALGPKQFVAFGAAHILYCGPDWGDKEKRLEKEIIASCAEGDNQKKFIMNIRKISKNK